jgi:DNA-binding NarL/FixJ family response regulator
MTSVDAYGLLLSDDMIFSSRITGTAQALGLKVNAVKSAKNLMAQAKERTPTCVIVDLSHPDLRVPELIGELQDVCSPIPRLVAYGSHVDAATLRAARDAGCDIVLPRSAFVEQLSGNLPQWLMPSS